MEVVDVTRIRVLPYFLIVKRNRNSKDCIWTLHPIHLYENIVMKIKYFLWLPNIRLTREHSTDSIFLAHIYSSSIRYWKNHFSLIVMVDRSKRYSLLVTAVSWCTFLASSSIIHFPVVTFAKIHYFKQSLWSVHRNEKSKSELKELQ